MRPVLADLFASTVRERDARESPAALGRERLGDQLWKLVDPATPIERHSLEPGPSRHDFLRILDQLEQLSDPSRQGRDYPSILSQGLNHRQRSKRTQLK
jgi:hypothetical protein